jgi:hypothetical protein
LSSRRAAGNTTIDRGVVFPAVCRNDRRNEERKIMEKDRILTLTDAGRLGEVLRATEGTRRVVRLVGDDVVTGTARRFGEAGTGNSLWECDVRDQYLWVTTGRGMEVFWPVSELMGEVNTGMFAVNRES